MLLAFDEQFRPVVVMAEAPHGTAPALAGKNVANPMAMILAGGAVLDAIGTPGAKLAKRAIHELSLKQSTKACARPTSVATRQRPNSPMRSFAGCGPSSTSGLC